MAYYPGATPRLSCDFYSSGVLTDPTTITLKVLGPDGTTSTYTYALSQITKDATGKYHKDVTLSTEGTWRWRWEGTGTVPATTEGEIEVTRSPFV